MPSLAELYKSTETSPPATGPKIQPGKNIIFVSCGQSAQGCSGPANEMANAAKVVGWNYKIIDGANNVNNGWAAGLRQAIAAKPDAIVIHGMGCGDVKQPLLEAKAAGIPVVGLESVDCTDPKNDGGPSESLFTGVKFSDSATTTGAFFKEFGRLQAAYVIDATEGKAKIVRTTYDPLLGAYQKEGQDEVFAKCPGCKVVGEVNWSAADSNAGGPLVQKFRTLLVQHPDANAAIMNWDALATSSGLSKAIKDAGYANSMIGVAGEGYAAALQLIRENGGLTAEPAAIDAKWLGWAGVDTLNRVLHGEQPVPEGVGFRLVDKDHNMMPDGQDYQTPVDYRGVYKKSWGVAD
ncbi:sugar ABC transporter substrate-binding protein [Amycolatopsis pithecellobii]|uniref:sugar ABC transporter substrate-binding protein n=1 Tax=Amycolatopsis pithecellobii TaxID=664692 RepID=UPI00140A5E9C|nr:substrate-binding domain-containing protein [Amycolatopsis pithecellobii]